MSQSCDYCGSPVISGLDFEDANGNRFCNKTCYDNEQLAIHARKNQPPLPLFDGWDDGTLHGADTYSKKYNSIYESWEQTAFRTRNT